MSNKKVVFASIMGAILATSILALNPSTIRNTQAELYYDEYYDGNTYYKDHNNGYGHYNDKKKSSDANVQNIKCNNIIINKNGQDVEQPPENGDMTAVGTLQALDNKNSALDEEESWLAALNEESQGNINFDKNVVNVCINKNNNQITVGEPPTIPTPQTCEECLQTTLGETGVQQLVDLLDNDLIPPNNIDEFCDFIQNQDATMTIPEITETIELFFTNAGIIDPEGEAEEFVQCLLDIGFLTPDP